MLRELRRMYRSGGYLADILLMLVVGLVVVTGSHTWMQQPAQQPAGSAAPVAAERSGQWSRVRAAYVRKHPLCEACGAKKDLEVHHIRPFHLYPALELDPNNLIALCDRCHIVFGHLGDYKAWNPNVRKDAAAHRRAVDHRMYTRESNLQGALTPTF